MFEVIGKNNKGDAMVLDYSDFVIEGITSEELEEAREMGLQINEGTPLDLDTFDFSQKSMSKMETSRGIGLIKLRSKDKRIVLFSLFSKTGQYVPALGLSLSGGDEGNALSVISVNLGYVIDHYYFFRVAVGCNEPANLDIMTSGALVASIEMVHKPSVWSKYFLSIPMLVDLNTLKVKFLPEKDGSPVTYSISNYAVRKSSTGEAHIVSDKDGKSMYNISKFLKNEGRG